MQNITLPPDTNFWDMPCKSLLINEWRLRKFLESHGFGLFQTGKKRTSDKTVFHLENGILKFHNEETVKSWVLEYFESQPEVEFGDSGKFENKTIPTTQGKSIKYDILNLIQSFNGMKNVLKTLQVFRRGFQRNNEDGTL